MIILKSKCYTEFNNEELLLLLQTLRLKVTLELRIRYTPRSLGIEVLCNFNNNISIFKAVYIQEFFGLGLVLENSGLLQQFHMINIGLCALFLKPTN